MFGDIIALIIITIIVLWSVAVVFRHVMPNTAKRVNLSLANYCQTKQWYSLAKFFQKKSNTGCHSSDDSPCSKCKNPTSSDKHQSSVDNVVRIQAVQLKGSKKE
ncbi:MULTISPECIES: DUF6587 family protein [unclassified Acinetobacter]|uniref:DUF6587 family protein n=1 Tax=unclassified Acinetobacter TaxID=196816 RepID=UPI0035BAA5C1